MQHNGESNYDAWKTSENEIPQPKQKEAPEYDHEKMSFGMLLMKCKSEAIAEMKLAGTYDSN